jgi:hypothetical protein
MMKNVSPPSNRSELSSPCFASQPLISGMTDEAVRILNFEGGAQEEAVRGLDET